MTHPSGKQISDLVEALLSAYPTRDDLRMLVRIELEESLEAIADGANQRVVIFNLITWAERSGRVDDLVAGAIKANPGNPMLKALSQTWSPAAPSPARPMQATPSGPAAIDVFLSYSRQNLDAMRVVEASLRGAGLSVWTDEGLEAGTPSWTAAIEEAVGQAQVMVVLLSPAAKRSVWVDREVALAETLGKRIFPILIEGTARSAVPFRLINVQWIDGRQALRQAAEQLQIGVLRAIGRRPVARTEAEPSATNAIKRSLADKPRREPAPAASEADDKGVVVLKPSISVSTETTAVLPLVHPEPSLSQYPIEFDWVLITGGEFHMGSDKARFSSALPDQMPQHPVFLDSFYITRVPVTNSQYAVFTQATGHKTPWRWHNGEVPPGKEHHPVVYVSWHDVTDFCQWAGVCLPTEAQWEKAARGTDGRIYPWGDTPPDKTLANLALLVGDTTPVDSYLTGCSPYGMLDMAGNVWEWVADWYDASYYRNSPQSNPTGPAEGERRVLRGGSWGSRPELAASSVRARFVPISLSGDWGFRVVVCPSV